MDQLLTRVLERGGSDLHLVVGCPPRVRCEGRLKTLVDDILTREAAAALVSSIMDDEKRQALEQQRELDFAYSTGGRARFRVNACYERDSLMAVMRSIPPDPLPLESLGFPAIVKQMTEKPRGLVLCTGAAGSGKSTTLAAMIDHINSNRSARILTIEDPIECMHASKVSTISQREVGRDSLSFRNALRSALRQDPDVVLVGEMRDLETIALALTAAETGQLVFATMHTISAAEAINRIVDIFPPEQQQQIRTQLAGVLEAVFTQVLVPKADGSGRVAALEILVGTSAVRNLIREGKTSHIDSAIQTGAAQGMQTLDKHLAELVDKGVISFNAAISKSSRPEELRRLMGGITSRPVAASR